MTASRDSFWQRALRSVRSRLALPRDSAAPTPGAGTSARRDALAVGETFAGYRIERELARGAIGALYAATDPRDGQAVALKALALAREFEGADYGEARERFLHEAEAASRLKHPDIVTVHGGGEWQGIGFIVMELLDGTDLTRYTRPSRLLPEPVVLRIGARVADALAHAHRLGVVHRDIKPANVMVDLAAHRVTVTDFGVARVTDSSRTRSGLVLGTPSFMSPEQLAGAAIDGRSDLYALGVMLYQLLTGELPYEAASLGRLLQQIAVGTPRDPRDFKPDLPAGLAELLLRTLHKAPAERPADGDALAAELRRIEAAWPGARLP